MWRRGAVPCARVRRAPRARLGAKKRGRGDEGAVAIAPASPRGRPYRRRPAGRTRRPAGEIQAGAGYSKAVAGRPRQIISIRPQLCGPPRRPPDLSARVAGAVLVSGGRVGRRSCKPELSAASSHAAAHDRVHHVDERAGAAGARRPPWHDAPPCRFGSTIGPALGAGCCGGEGLGTGGGCPFYAGPVPRGPLAEATVGGAWVGTIGAGCPPRGACAAGARLSAQGGT